jgi:GNAT superfamily N-acetyltransferase
METLTISCGYVPGAIGRIAELHGRYYAKHWKFGLYFEAKVATALSEFLQRYDRNRDGFWTAARNDRIEGSIAIDGVHAAREGAHLRWFIVSEELHGRGAGSLLIDKALFFCRQKKYRRVYLWTFQGLDSARHLYEKAGFKLIEQFTGKQWGPAVEEQRFELQL